jgi:hypothetical protein
MTTMTTGTKYVQTTNPDGTVTFIAKPVDFGCYTTAADVSGTAAFEASVGPMPWRLDFGDEGGMFGPGGDTWPIAQWKGCGRKLLLGVPMIPNCAPGAAGPLFAAVAAGTYDAVFKSQAQALVANGFGASNCMIRLGWEFNGGWFPWAANGMAAEFIAAFRRIVKVTRSVIPGLPTMWNPTRGDLGVGDLATYFPGAPYVTCAALDVYDTQWQTGAITEPAEFNFMLAQPYGLAWLVNFCKSQGVQCGLGEWGLWAVGTPGTNSEQGGGDDPAFITSMVAWIKANCTGPAIIWNNGACAFSNYPNALAALKKTV